MEKDNYRNLEIELNNFLNSPELIRKILILRYGYNFRVKHLGESVMALTNTIYTYLGMHEIPYNSNLVETYLQKNMKFMRQKIGTEIKKLKLEDMLRN